jgi:tRNA(fMet)-specific endonuclease VapC
VRLHFLLDTNVLSEPVRPVPHPGVLLRLHELREQVATAALVWNELLFGCKRLPPSQKREAIEGYLFRTVRASIPVLPYDRIAAEWHAGERARLTALGKAPPFVDGQIAAIARVNNLVLVTSNRSHFEPFEGLEIQNWKD